MYGGRVAQCDPSEMRPGRMHLDDGNEGKKSNSAETKLPKSVWLRWISGKNEQRYERVSLAVLLAFPMTFPRPAHPWTPVQRRDQRPEGESLYQSFDAWYVC